MEYVIQFQNEAGSLKQELSTLLSTRAGSVPVLRDYGISWECLDAPPEVAESLFYQELLKKTEEYIPNLEIKSVEFTHEPEGGELCVGIACRRRKNRE